MSKNLRTRRKESTRPPLKSFDDLARTMAKPTEVQIRAIAAIEKYDIVALTGPAGTGKTSAAVRAALKLLGEKRIERLILSRPVVPFGEEIGFLPGDIRDKLGPWVAPIDDVLRDLVLDRKEVMDAAEIVPVAFLQGRTFSSCVALLDEAQNTSWAQLEMFLTRLGRGGKLILCGDPYQSAIGTKSGFAAVIDHVLRHLPFAAVIDFPASSAVRHPNTAQLLDALDRGRATAFGQHRRSESHR